MRRVRKIIADHGAADAIDRGVIRPVARHGVAGAARFLPPAGARHAAAPVTTDDETAQGAA